MEIDMYDAREASTRGDGAETGVDSSGRWWMAPTTRKGFLTRAAVAGATATGIGALGPVAALAKPGGPIGPGNSKASREDLAILGAAQIAEALAVTTYTNIINTAPFFKHLAEDDQGYLRAAVQEEMSHYLLEESVTGKPSPFTTFYYPPNMFTNAQTTLNVLVTLEDAFIAAYLVGVRDFSTPDLRVTAARIMGIESDHRTLCARGRPGGGQRRRRPDRADHRDTESGGVRRPPEQQRLRAHAWTGANLSSGRSARAVRGQVGCGSVRLRRVAAVHLRSLHAHAAECVG
jgi:hypothetical protein